MKTFLTALLLCYVHFINSQSWKEYYQNSQQNSIENNFEEAEYNALLALLTAKKEHGLSHESYDSCLVNLNNIFIQITKSEDYYFSEIESLDSDILLMYKKNFNKNDVKLFALLNEKGNDLSKSFNNQLASQFYLRAYKLVSEHVFKDDQYFILYENLLRKLSNNFNEDKSDFIIKIYEDQLVNLKNSINNLTLNYINHFDNVLKAYIAKNEVNKSKETLILMETLYTKNKGKRKDDYISLYLNIGDEFQDIDMKSALIFYEMAYDKLKNLKEFDDTMLLSEVYERLSTANFTLKKYETAMSYDLESLNYLNDVFHLEKVKFRLIKAYYSIGEKDKAYKLIHEIELENEKRNKQSDQYLITKVKIADMFFENDDYKPALPLITQIIAIFSNKAKVNLYDVNSYNFYLSKCYYYTNQTEKAKEVFQKIDSTKIYDELHDDYIDFKKIVNAK
jgi:hypothetical protein